jgi:hypothetical protein
LADRRRAALVLIMHHLVSSGYLDTAERLSKEVSCSFLYLPLYGSVCKFIMFELNR